jgi:hypothetical protein
MIHCVQAAKLDLEDPYQLLLEPPPALGLGGNLVGNKPAQGVRVKVAPSHPSELLRSEPSARCVVAGWQRPLSRCSLKQAHKQTQLAGNAAPASWHWHTLPKATAWRSAASSDACACGTQSPNPTHVLSHGAAVQLGLQGLGQVKVPASAGAPQFLHAHQLNKTSKP